MKVNEIEINGKIYRANYIKDANDCNICEHCDLASYCDRCEDEAALFDLCQTNPFKWCFKEVKQKENINTKFYRFSTGAVFNVNHIDRIITIGEIKHYEEGNYSFLITTVDWSANILNKSKLALSKERNKFIKFIEEYETLD